MKKLKRPTFKLPVQVVALVVCWFWFATSCTAQVTAFYHDDFREHYPTRGQRFEMRQFQLEAPVVVWDENHVRKITIVRTRGDKYGYDDQKCVINLEGKGLEKARFLSVLGFRNIEASWITGKLVLFKIGIGHVAAVDAIYDAEKDSFVDCESVTYAVGVEETGPKQSTKQPTNGRSPPVGGR